MMNTKKVWFVTGASKGLGLALVQELLAEGYRVAATSRNLPALIQAAGKPSENFLPLETDLVNEQSVEQAIANTLAHFKAIDVVVNNAGYGQFGALEELSDEEARQSFDVNVFGVLHVIRHTMPHFRRQRSGNFFNISSIGGYSARFAGAAIYCATKFAVTALSEGLAAEVEEFNVNVTCVYPGYFRTNFLSQGSLAVPKNFIEDYKAARAALSFHQNEMNGTQEGDPARAAAVLIKLSEEKSPPLHLFLGEDSYKLAYAKMDEVKKDLEQWKSDTVSTGFAVLQAN